MRTYFDPISLRQSWERWRLIECDIRNILDENIFAIPASRGLCFLGVIVARLKNEMNLFRKRRMNSNSSRESRSKKIRTEEKQACRSYSDQKAEMAKPIRSYWVALLGVPKVWSTLPVSVSSPELFNNFGTGGTSKYFGLPLTVKPTQCVSLIQLENCPAENHGILQKWEITDLNLESRPRPKLCHP